MSIRKYKTRRGATRYAVNVYDKRTGKTRWVGTFRTSEDAKSAEAEALRDIRLGRSVTKPREITFSDLSDQWLESLNVRQTTIDDYERTAKHLKRYFGSTLVSGIGKREVELFISWAVEQGWSAHYVRKMKTRLAQIMNTAVDWELIPSSPVGRVRNLPKAPPKKIQPLEPEQVRALIDAAPAHWRVFFQFAVATGMRRGELFGLQWSDFDFKANEVRVVRQLGRYGLSEVKTSRGRRTIPISRSLAIALQELRFSQHPMDHELVFRSDNGGPVDASNWYARIWKPTIREAGLPETTKLHDLRRTFASAQVAMNRSQSCLTELMGHANISTTLTYYSAAYPEEKRKSADEMEDWMAREVG